MVRFKRGRLLVASTLALAPAIYPSTKEKALLWLVKAQGHAEVMRARQSPMQCPAGL
jgi:hypothetical protein